MQAYFNQDFKTKDGRLISDGDALTHQDDLSKELGEGALVLSRAAVKRIGTGERTAGDDGHSGQNRQRPSHSVLNA